jgi:mRNA interferase MazF
MPSVFARGEIVLTRFPFTDVLGASIRPALVVSQGLIGQDLVLAGISSVVRGASVPTDLVVDLSHTEFGQSGLRVTSVIRLHKLATVDHAIIARRLGRLGPRLQSEVDRLLRQVLGL